MPRVMPRGWFLEHGRHREGAALHDIHVVPPRELELQSQVGLAVQVDDQVLLQDVLA